jgi:ribonuclease E
MTRKRIGTGLLEAFSETCEHCQGRGLILHDAPIEDRSSDDDSRRGGRRNRGRGRDGGSGNGNGDGNGNGNGNGNAAAKLPPSPKVLASSHPPAEPEAEPIEPPEPAENEPDAPTVEPVQPAEPVETLRDESLAESVELVETPDAEPEQDSPVEVIETTPEPAPVVEPPRVVTRTRRRSASRPAGPPTEATEAPPGSSTLGTFGAPASDGLVEPNSADLEPGTPNGYESSDGAHPELHVPIKKKGSRKR